MEFLPYPAGLDEILNCDSGVLEFFGGEEGLEGLEVAGGGFLEGGDGKLGEGLLESEHGGFGGVFSVPCR